MLSVQAHRIVVPPCYQRSPSTGFEPCLQVPGMAVLMSRKQTETKVDNPRLPRVGYVTIEDVRSWHAWPKNEVGHIANAYTLARVLHEQQFPLEYLGPLPGPSRLLRLGAKVVGVVTGKKLFPQVEPSILRNQARHISRHLPKADVDILLGNNSRPFAALRTTLPIVVWRDSTFAGALSVHRDFDQASARSIRLGHAMEKAALENCTIAIFRSQWAADSAIHDYGIAPERIRVLQTGGNLRQIYPRDQVVDMVATRSRECCELLFIAVDWQGKGGDVVLEVARQLHKAGTRVRITIVGSRPATSDSLPPNILFIEYVDFQSDAGWLQYETMLAKSHFLIFPTRVDTYGNVLPESNAFAVPCLSSKRAGIPSIIHNGVNGQLFTPAGNDEVDGYCDFITEAMRNYDQYLTLAMSSYDEYRARLSWDVVGQSLGRIIQEAIEIHR